MPDSTSLAKVRHSKLDALCRDFLIAESRSDSIQLSDDESNMGELKASVEAETVVHNKIVREFGRLGITGHAVDGLLFFLRETTEFGQRHSELHRLSLGTIPTVRVVKAEGDDD